MRKKDKAIENKNLDLEERASLLQKMWKPNGEGQREREKESEESLPPFSLAVVRTEKCVFLLLRSSLRV